MTTSRPRVSLGDAVRALATLRPTDSATATAILSVVGLTAEAPEAPPPPPEPEPMMLPDDAEEEPAARAGDERKPVHEDVDDGTSLGDEVASALEVQPTVAAKGIENVRQMPKDEGSSLPPIQPLLLPQWVRGILSAALSVPLPDGPPDVERLVEAIARGEAIASLPRRPAPTLRLGVQLLVDRSARMAPFAKDQAWLEWALRRIVGENGVEARRFVGSPLGVVADAPRRDAVATNPALPGRPVLALTDLGIARPMFDDDRADAEDWLELDHVLVRAGCPLIVFVPYPPSRLPPALAAVLTIVQWDRVTSAATVRGLLRPVAT
jgi:hypothetical protein